MYRRIGKRIAGLLLSVIGLIVCAIPMLKQLCYMEISLDTFANWFISNYFVKVGKARIDIKTEELFVYKEIMRPYPYPRSTEALEGLATCEEAQARSIYGKYLNVHFIECKWRKACIL